eukprot:Phypoly_transcript_18237.p1 GENE.Phypoly_transcript_18237~~Phypoly_transcript_18237.p1  ORF type:complete len:239 (+),score=57.24 Phypoly_transcript_18237:101-718(+)
MASLFKKAQKKPTPEQAISHMKDTLATLDKRIDFLEHKIQNEENEAKRYVAMKNKRGALMCLKKKKLMQAQIEKLSGASLTLHTQLAAIENSKVTSEIIGAMHLGATVMKDQTKHINADKVDNLMADIEDQMEIHREISDAISQSFGMQFDEDELDAELEALEEENLNETLGVVNVPQVKVAKPARSVEEEEEEELRKLEMSLAV